MELTPEQHKKFQNKIWNFYKKNKRTFPWRNISDPYKIMVSEFMLQQTQTSRVLPKYTEFIKTFPTLEKLHNAKISNVLNIWNGLGYNRRALYLKNAAGCLLTSPKIHPENLVKIKGIGKNTAGAIYVFSKNKPYAFIETNIRRVFIHEFFKSQENISDKEILDLVEKTQDKKSSREWYYALMDYGAYLSKLEKNPNRKSKHYSKQSKFEGSERQARGNILKILIKTKHMPIQVLKEKINSNYFDKALRELEKENFLTLEGKSAKLR